MPIIHMSEEESGAMKLAKCRKADGFYLLTCSGACVNSRSHFRVQGCPLTPEAAPLSPWRVRMGKAAPGFLSPQQESREASDAAG